ncbi:metallophosphoesterase [Mucilaginibacter sp. RS28]|uniref:Metallophosphoesterase n=1 Tax=Mucilaginibacter straminoryzae TaxID=2932774 RepID=A0A9X2BBU6_9SPHI|nr:metallophosphoesterase [Mucilaginibacter straminoryzae]MCJ8212085.1 metallophosphoesterase [Mucilaginibacter straminoryzae]
MTRQTVILLIISAALLIADAYIIKGLKSALKWRFLHNRWFSRIYWGVSIVLIIGIFLSIFVKLGMGIRAGLLLCFFLLLIAKVLLILFLFADDVRRWIIKAIKKPNEQPATVTTTSTTPKIPRSEFLVKAGLLAGALPVGALTWGIIDGVYDYRVRRQTLYLPNLPKKFDGIRLGQISDIHSGSFYNKKAVAGGVEMLMREKPDFIFFTGDLVNDIASEMRDYQDIFSKVKAPLGVYSSLGNHDYGDYSWWPNLAAKQKNHQDLIDTHKRLGWDLLLNENRRLKIDGEEIGILGVENWGLISRFPKRGRLDLATKDTGDLPVKLLLSHDPSHWRAQVLDKYPDIDVMFSGHTHGMQCGIRTAEFQWSPIEFVYKEWAGLYQENKQQLYVNVGYGFLGYPGRVGILPEITIFELKAAHAPNQS